jgi:hypothetical protein
MRSREGALGESGHNVFRDDAVATEPAGRVLLLFVVAR